jgi:hypothetical protein
MKTLDAGVYQGQTLVFHGGDRWVVGPGVRFENCQIALNECTSRTVQFLGGQFVNCRIVVTEGLVGFGDWCRCQVVGCTFAGTLEDNCFGLWSDEYGPNGGMSNCDFSEAGLRGCQFLGVDVTSLVFPKWPYFTLLDPVVREAELLGFEWPGKLSFWIEGAVLSPEATVAVSYDARDLVPGFDCSLEEIREHLQRLGGVLM